MSEPRASRQPSSWPALPGIHVILQPCPHPRGPLPPAGWGAGQDAESRTGYPPGRRGRGWGITPSPPVAQMGSCTSPAEPTRPVPLTATPALHSSSNKKKKKKTPDRPSSAESRRHLNQLSRDNSGAGSQESCRVGGWGELGTKRWSGASAARSHCSSRAREGVWPTAFAHGTLWGRKGRALVPACDPG